MGERVTVIGLGNMGSALASALLKSDRTVTVWNRTQAKAAPLVTAGAIIAGSPAEAVAASDVIVICVFNYDNSDEILAGCMNLSGKTLIQLTTGDPKRAEATQVWALRNGALYLDGAILGGPEEAGRPDLTIAIAGSEAAWNAGKGVVETLGGASAYLGTNLAAPLAFEAATSSVIMMAAMGAINGAYLLEKAGVDVGLYAQIAPSLGGYISHYLQTQVAAIATNTFDKPHAALGAWAAGAQYHIHSPDLAAPMRALMEEAVAAGYANEELASVIKVLRAPKN